MSFFLIKMSFFLMDVNVGCIVLLDSFNK